MIYLIGGAPRTGKTTVAKTLAKQLNISWISTDTLEVIVREYQSQRELKRRYPYTHERRKKGQRDNDDFYRTYSSKKIVGLLLKQARANEAAISCCVEQEVANGRDMILEGYHLTPAFITQLRKKYPHNVTAVILLKSDAKQFAKDAQKSTDTNDWLILCTKEPETFERVGMMVKEMSTRFEQAAKKYRLATISMDGDRTTSLNHAITALTT